MEDTIIFTKGLGEVAGTRDITKLMSELSQRPGSYRQYTEAEANAAVNLLKEAITIALQKGAKVQLTGFMNFGLTYRAARKGNNVFTKEPIDIPESVAVSAKVGSALKEVGKQLDYEMIQGVKALKAGKTE